MSEPWIHVAIRVHARLCARDAVAEVLRSVCRLAERDGRERELEWRVVTAFNEAFNNVVNYAYAPGQHGDVCIDVTVDAARLVLELRDDGYGFDFEARSRAPLPELDALDAGGMGLFLIRNAMSSVSYERGAPNRLRMIREFETDADVRDPNDEAPQC